MRISRVSGLLLATAGVVLALWPVLSVWRVSGQVLDELPPIDGVETTDDRSPLSALTDPEFRLATRTYRGAEPETVESALLAAGFTRSGPAGQLSRDCCGEYDAVWVDVTDGSDALVIAELTTADADVQVAGPIFALLGLCVIAIGIGLAMMGPRARPDQGMALTE